MFMFYQYFHIQRRAKRRSIYVNSDFARTNSKHHKGPVSCHTFLLEFIQFTSSLPGLLSMAYISTVVFNLS